MPWERHSSSRRWERQRSALHARRRRLPGCHCRALLGRPPPPPPTRTAGGSLVSHPGAGAARSAPAPRSVARRSITRRAGGPEGQTAPGLGGRERRPARRSPRSAGLHRLSGRPLPGGPSALMPQTALVRRGRRRRARRSCRAVIQGCASRSGRGGPRPSGSHAWNVVSARGRPAFRRRVRRSDVKAPRVSAAAIRTRSPHSPPYESASRPHEQSRAASSGVKAPHNDDEPPEGGS